MEGLQRQLVHERALLVNRIHELEAELAHAGRTHDQSGLSLDRVGAESVFSLNSSIGSTVSRSSKSFLRGSGRLSASSDLVPVFESLIPTDEDDVACGSTSPMLSKAAAASSPPLASPDVGLSPAAPASHPGLRFALAGFNALRGTLGVAARRSRSGSVASDVDS